MIYIRQIRESKGVTLEQLSNRSGVSIKTLERGETSGEMITSRNLTCIADALDVSVDEILGRTKPIKRPVIKSSNYYLDCLNLIDKLTSKEMKALAEILQSKFKE